MADFEVVLETPWFSIERVPSGPAASDSESPYYRLKQGDGVVVLVVDEDGRMVLVRQYRPPLGRETLETPAGFIDDGEAPEDAARREVHEETGYICDDIVYLGVGRSLMNRVTSREHMLLATGARRDPDFVPSENIDIVVVEPGEFAKMVDDGDYEQMAAFALLFLARHKLGWSPV